MSDPNMYRQQWAAPVAQPPAAVQPYRPGHVVPGAASQGQLVSPGGRLGAFLLDGLLMVFTLFIGWFIWSMVTWSDGQSPGKKLLGYVVADANTGQPFDWGRMAVREFGVKGLLGWLLDVVTLSVYFWVDAFTVFGDRQRTLHDRMAGSIVRHL
ncbi:RDD family protein [Paractinoplanes atraurantiacus]|uniref:RDD family protein n=2 Tax=Paractinoplanes atraurantiacus TaxID=1036182 RepID=A0A285J2H3_9ACTN|nr:RDD family protein [Actinoplanes atraurantiacus]